MKGCAILDFSGSMSVSCGDERQTCPGSPERCDVRGGLDYHFVGKVPEELVCGICSKVLKLRIRLVPRAIELE